jgi:hypothetical protein
MKTIIENILGQMKVSLPQLKFLSHLFSLLLYFQGKANFRNLSRYSDFHEKTFSRHFRKDFDFSLFNRSLVQHIPSQPPSQYPLLLALDPSFVSKSGSSTYGLDAFYNGSTSRPEKGLEISVVALVDIEANTAYTLSVKQTPPSEKPSEKPSTKTPSKKSKEPPKETRIDFYLNHLISSLPYVPQERFERKYGVVDGFFAKKKFVEGACNAGLEVVSKLRVDANLWTSFEGEQKKQGRKRIYGEKIRCDSFEGWKEEMEVDVGVVQSRGSLQTNKNQV